MASLIEDFAVLPESEKPLPKLLSGKIGELHVELELTVNGWHVERLDGAAKAANGDLIAIKGEHKVVIQVKTNSTQPGRAFLAHAGRFLNDGEPFFNSKMSAIRTDIVVSVVTDKHRSPEFYVFMVDEAEKLAQSIAINWDSTLKRNGQQRSKSFPITPKVDTISVHRDKWDKLFCI
jgi:hypothetical protein